MYDQDDDYDYEMITRTVQSFSDELDYRIKIEGCLERVQYDESGEVVERIQVGRIKAIQYWLESVITGRTSVWDLLDADSQEACEIYEELFDPELDEFKLKVSERVKDTFLMRNMLYIHSVEILPEFRGKGIGLQAMRKFLKAHHIADGLTVTCPAPMNPQVREWEDDWSQKMQYDQFQSSYEQAQTKLAKHWKQVGFLPIPDSKWHIWYSFPEDRLPDPLWN